MFKKQISLLALICTCFTSAAFAQPAAKSAPATANSPFDQFEEWHQEFKKRDHAGHADLVSKGVAVARARRAALKQLIKDDPEAALRLANAHRDDKNLPKEISSLLEEDVVGVGRYSVFCVTPLRDQAGAEPDIQRTFTSNGREYRVHGSLDKMPVLTTETISVIGVAVDNEMAWASGQPILSFGDSSPGSSDVYQRPSTNWTFGNKKILVIRIDFPDLAGDPVYLYNTNITMTTNYCVGVFNNTNGIRDFYKQNSFGKTDLLISAADVTPVYRMPSNALWYARGDSNRFFGAEMQAVAYAAAEADGFHFTNYDRIGLVNSYMGGLSNSLMKFAGQGEIGGRYFFINGAYDFSVLAHEFGHTYGVLHANYWKNRAGTTVGSEADHLANFQTGEIFAVSQEYGDIFDGMGANGGAFDLRHHFNHWFKNLLGWIPDTSITTVTNSGTYRIYRFDNQDVNLAGTNQFALKICRDYIRDYWVGYRCNFTNLTNGAYLLYGYNTNLQSELLDCNTPGTSLLDASVNVGQFFTDTNSGVTITPLAKGGVSPNEYLDVQVTLQPRLSFTSLAAGVETLDGSISATVERLGNFTGITTVNYSCVDGTGLHGATNGVHYIGSLGTLTWGNGDSTKRTLTFQVMPFAVSNGYRNFTVVLSNPTNGVVINPYKYTMSVRPAGNAVFGFKSELPAQTVYSIALQPDGKILTGGTFTNAGIKTFDRDNRCGNFTRLNTDGTRDWSFQSSPGANNGILKIKRQADGKIIIVGGFTAVHGIPRTNIARLNVDGSLDTSFAGPTFNNGIQDVAIQPDGKIVVSGDFLNVDGKFAWKAARLNPNGSLDWVFAPSGYGSSFAIKAIALDNYSSGNANEVRILLAGSIGTGFPFTNSIVRVKSNGTPDPTFVQSGVGGNSAGNAVAIQSDGKILLGGFFTAFNGDSNYQALVRLNPNGSHDTSFHVTMTNGGSIGYPVCLEAQPDGKIIVGGIFTKVNGLTNNNIVRLTDAGANDVDWDNGLDAENGCANWIFSMARQPDGKVLAASTSNGWPIRGGATPLQPLYTGVTNRYGIAQFTTANFTVRPGSSINIPVQRHSGSDGDVRLDYSTQADTAIAGTDFVMKGGTLNWNNGDAGAKTVMVTVPSNATVGRTFKVNLGIPNGGILAGMIQQTSVTISSNYNYEVWRTEKFSAAEQLDENVSGPFASVTPDGIKNFFKYAFGFDPAVVVTNNPMTATLISDRLHITFPRDPIKVDLTYELQASTDLVSWSPLVRSVAGGATLNLSALTVSETTSNSIVNVAVDDLATTITSSPRFIRLRVSR
ncbi:MAG: hypothetical protein JWM68_1313 [Verrucomicrobiales bacterium]|nr:hypothetical protein [Verrucomicrobiales bacterium]